MEKSKAEAQVCSKRGTSKESKEEGECKGGEGSGVAMNRTTNAPQVRPQTFPNQTQNPEGVHPSLSTGRMSSQLEA